MLANLYNNFCVAALGINFTLSYAKELSISKALLVMPFIMHNETVNYLSARNRNVRSIDELIIAQPNLFLNFNKRYYESLEASLNAIQFLNDIDWITIEDGLIKQEQYIPFNNEMGERLKKIFKSSSNLANILSDDNNKLYLSLRIEL